MARRNPNQCAGILITIKKIPSVKLPLPCQRLHRRVLEFLQEARVRSTEYTYTLSDVGSTDKMEAAVVTVTPKSDTSLEFGLSIVLGNGELFVGNLRAPVKCREDGLGTELARAAAAINSRGWHVTATEKEQTPSTSVPAPKHQRLIMEMEQLLRGLNTELQGAIRDEKRAADKKAGLQKTIAELREHIATLSTKPS